MGREYAAKGNLANPQAMHGVAAVLEDADLRRAVVGDELTFAETDDRDRNHGEASLMGFARGHDGDVAPRHDVTSMLWWGRR
ncbi:hypothetical protein Acsp02_90270 [Actinoplanes sp. NBRC 103695]|nr:hypothetical protein Acsp02_90270 [Actinoplanes sp. NBRC 103695]